MKAILVIDMPEDYMGSVIDVKLYGTNQTVRQQYVNQLRLIPQRRLYDDYFSRGWNACLDEIMEETE